jgi:hypothetical protein
MQHFDSRLLSAINLLAEPYTVAFFPNTACVYERDFCCFRTRNLGITFAKDGRSLGQVSQ